MSCKIWTDDEGNVTAISCGSSWGIGIYATGEPEGSEFEFIYGFPPTTMNPHDFTPDEDCTEKELLAWEEAKVVWDNKQVDKKSSRE